MIPFRKRPFNGLDQGFDEIPPDTPTLYGHVIGSDYYADGIMLVWCPNCETYHRHGWTGDTEREHKAAGCFPHGYYVAPDPASQDVWDDPRNFDQSLWDNVHDVEVAEGDSLDPYRLATLYLSKHPNTVYWRDEFYEWDRPAYVQIGTTKIESRLLSIIQAELDAEAEEYIKRFTRYVMDSEHIELIKQNLWSKASEIRAEKQKRITRTLMVNVLGCLRPMCQKDAGTSDAFWLSDIGMELPLFVAKNCMVFDGGDHFYGVPLSPQFFTTSALDYSYDPSAACPLWEKFIDDVLGTASDRALALQEIAGYLVTEDTKFQKIPMFFGAKRSGKGTVARVISGLVGEKKVCNPNFKSLQGQFGLQPFCGKTLAVVGDARLSGRADAEVIVERLLSISGEDSQNIDIKYKAQINTKLKVRFLILSNELPLLNDASATLPSRCIPIPFDRSFYGQEDLDLTEKLLKERPGILNWALAGLKRLREQGHFTQPEASKDILHEMEELSSPVRAFLNDCCEIQSGSETVSDVYSAWEIWCELSGRRASNVQVFGRDLRAAANVKVTRPRSGGLQIRSYEPLKLNDKGMQLKTEAANRKKKSNKGTGSP